MASQSPATDITVPPQAQSRLRVPVAVARRHPVIATALGIVALWLIVLGVLALDAWRQVDALDSLQKRDIAALSSADARNAARQLEALNRDLRWIDRLTGPAFVSNGLSHAPLAGPRIEAGQRLLIIGEQLSGAGARGAKIGARVLVAYEQTGMTTPAAANQQTWLDVVTQHDGEIRGIVDEIDAARVERQEIQDADLPGPIRSRLPTLDRLLDHNDLQGYVNTNLPALQIALGAEQPVRYLVLFENPAELRPTGGFFGTCALVTISRGQIVDYQFFSSYPLTVDYGAQRKTQRAQPWPIDRYLHDPQHGLLFHDGNWYADFPRSANLIMSMYSETNWPPIDGVVAVVPAVVEDLMQLTGPITLNVDGVDRTFTADHIQDEIETQRLMQASPDATTHKELLAEIGEQIVERLKVADRSVLADAADVLQHSADRRDIQMYSPDPTVESTLDARHWSGRLIPDANVPTLALTFANFEAGKSSNLMKPTLRLTVGDAVNGERQMALHLTMTHTGSPDAHPFYSGLQQWWVQVALPSGSSAVTPSMSQMPDPEAPIGGSYYIELNPQQSASLDVSWLQPDGQHLLFRRQPGLSTLEVTIDGAACQAPLTLSLDRDQTVDLDALCPAP
jgi:hypothetical protein